MLARQGITQFALDISQVHINTEEMVEEKEEEDDDQYTYEVPPSEGHNKRLAPAKQQEAAENLYLGKGNSMGKNPGS